jgi:PST family polysaccharide transporter
VTEGRRDDGLDFDDDVGELKRRSVRGGMAFGALQGGQILAQLAWTVVMARLLAPADFGLVAMVMPLVVLMGVVSDMGLTQAVLQRPRLDYAELSNLFWLAQAVHLGLFVLFLAVCPLIGLFYGREEVTWIAAAYCAVLPISGLSAVHGALMTRRLQFARVGAVKLLSFMAGAAAGVAVGAVWQTYWALVAMGITTSLAGVALSWVASGWVPGKPRRDVDVRGLLGFGGNVASHRLTTFLAGNADTVLVGKVWGEVALGFYDRAFRLMVTPTSLITRPLGTMAPAVLSRLFSDPARYRRAVLGLMRLVLLATVPGITFAVVMAPTLIPLVYGPGWEPVAPIFQAFGVAAILRFQLVMLEWLFVTEDKTRRLRQWGMFRAALLLAGFAIGIRWGALGVATAYAAVTTVLLLPALSIWATRGSPVRLADVAVSIGMFLPGIALAAGGMLILRDHAGLDGWAALLAALALAYAVVPGAAMAVPAGRRSVRAGWDLWRGARRAGG